MISECRAMLNCKAVELPGMPLKSRKLEQRVQTTLLSFGDLAKWLSKYHGSKECLLALFRISIAGGALGSIGQQSHE